MTSRELTSQFRSSIDASMHPDGTEVTEDACENLLKWIRRSIMRHAFPSS
jgi:hypothetical protein